jgi:hypothetical protein
VKIDDFKRRMQKSAGKMGKMTAGIPLIRLDCGWACASESMPGLAVQVEPVPIFNNT